MRHLERTNIMKVNPGVAASAILFVALGPPGLAAQIDYRNLDDHRPVTTEDAYPIERYAFELTAPYRYESEADGSNLHLVVPELAYGMFPNAELGVEAPLAALDLGPETDWGLAGLQVFGFYNFNTESSGLPALSVRSDLSFPVGSLAGEDTRLTLKGIATRTWGQTRFHLNVARGFGSEEELAPVEPADRWAYSVAADRTFFRQSMLLIGEVAASEAVRGAPTEVNGSLGARYQWSPTLVLDLGVTRRLRDDLGPDFAFTLGLSHAFAVRGLMPAGPR
jgi:hypothetical protein